MLLTLSAHRRREPPGLVELLEACHQRIRHFIGLCNEVARRGDVPTAETAQACADAARYFREALPLHVAETPFTGATDMAQLYAEQAARAGITIEVKREPEDGYWSNIWGKAPMFATKWSGRVNEDVMLSLCYARDSIGTWNETSWDNEAFNTALVAARAEKDEARRKELYWECQALVSAEGGMVAPVWADFIDATSDKVMHGEVGNDWELDGARACERWWFAA